MAPRKRCPVCRSKQWHKEPSSGLIVCSEGHILQNYRSETTEAEDLGSHALRKRTLKTGHKKKGRESKANPNLYHGARGRYLYFQCQQLILRKQIVALTRLMNLPTELEVVCRDIWALHLSLLLEPPTPEPYHFTQDETKQTTGTPGEGADGELSDAGSGDDEEEGDQQTNEDIDHVQEEIEALLEQNSESESEGDEDADKANSGLPLPGRRKHRVLYESPANNLVVILIACWTLRVPLIYRDLLRFIELYELPYLDPLRLLPPDMVSHLTKHTVQALSPAQAPNILLLHSLTSRLARLLSSKFGVITPEANAAPILWRVTASLGGTPPLYHLIKKLSRILSLPLALHHTLVPGLDKVKTQDPDSHKYDDVPVELSFMAAGIVTLKLVYGLDGRTRSPRDPDDAACLLPSLSDILDTVRNLNDDLEREASTSASRMSDEMIDQYFSFCENALLPQHETERDKLLSYFPLASKRTSISVPPAYQRPNIQPTAVQFAKEPNDLRPGESYTLYHSRDVCGTMNEDLDLVLIRGSTWVGVGKEYLSGVVEKYERRLVRWWKENRERVE